VFLAFGDLARDLRGADHAAAVVADRRDGGRHHHQPAVLVASHGLHVVDAFAARDALEDRPLLVVQLGGKDLQQRLADGLARGVAEQPLGSGVPAFDDAAQVLADDGVVARFDDGRHAGAIVVQGAVLAPHGAQPVLKLTERDADGGEHHGSERETRSTLVRQPEPQRRQQHRQRGGRQRTGAAAQRTGSHHGRVEQEPGVGLQPWPQQVLRQRRAGGHTHGQQQPRGAAARRGRCKLRGRGRFAQYVSGRPTAVRLAPPVPCSCRRSDWLRW
jgi:hypothetical protein